MKTIMKLIFAAVVFAAIFTSCGKIPQAEIDGANQAIADAQAAGADIYVATDFAALQDSMRLVSQNVETQKAKMFSSYDDVKAQLVAITELAHETQGKAETRKEEVTVEIGNLEAEINQLLAMSNELVTQAPKGKEGAAALEAIKSENSSIQTSMNEVDMLKTNNQLIPALDKVSAAKEKAAAINAELNEVIAKYNRNKKK